MIKTIFALLFTLAPIVAVADPSITSISGTFSHEDTAYLYVVDNAGDANSSGYEITIGGAAQGGSISLGASPLGAMQ